MDPVTHAVIGMTIAKAAGNGIDPSNPASMGIIIGSVFPDIDILFQKWGDYVYLKNHRGASHSVPGLVASAAFIAAVLGVFYPGSSVFSIFLWSLLGCFSHTLIDVFNSYGAKLLWPLCERKFSLSLLIIFDPVMICTLLGYIFTSGSLQYLFIAMFACYLLSRVIMRLAVKRGLVKWFGENYKKISLLPSMTGLFRWHFVLEDDNCSIIGEKNILRNSVKVIRKLEKLGNAALDNALRSPVGRFFKEFTPLFHIAYEQAGSITRFVFIDLRYYIRNNFLHHAVLEIDESDGSVRQTFNPYSMNRANTISAKEI
jgi:inner membrane protein